MSEEYTAECLNCGHTKDDMTCGNCVTVLCDDARKEGYLAGLERASEIVKNLAIEIYVGRYQDERKVANDIAEALADEIKKGEI